MNSKPQYGMHSPVTMIGFAPRTVTKIIRLRTLEGRQRMIDIVPRDKLLEAIVKHLSRRAHGRVDLNGNSRSLHRMYA